MLVCWLAGRVEKTASSELLLLLLLLVLLNLLQSVHDYSSHRRLLLWVDPRPSWLRSVRCVGEVVAWQMQLHRAAALLVPIAPTTWPTAGSDRATAACAVGHHDRWHSGRGSVAAWSCVQITSYSCIIVLQLPQFQTATTAATATVIRLRIDQFDVHAACTGAVGMREQLLLQ